MSVNTQPRIFVHIPRNAGLTVRKSSSIYDLIVDIEPAYLKNKTYVEKLKTKLGDNYNSYHARWRDIDPDLRSLYVPFAVVRNPWSRAVSQYLLAKKLTEAGEVQMNTSSFESFLEERHVWEDVEYMWHDPVRSFYPQTEYVIDSDEQIQCDCLRFEDLNLNLKKYFRVDNLSPRRNVNTELKRDWKHMYNSKTRQIVADMYQKDIDTFGFDFDTPAQKNYWSSLK